jgi:osmotically-inducible protein OsmY
MKNTLLFSTLIAGIALTGCNKSTRTSTADTTAPATDTTMSTPATTDTAGARLDRATDRAADATRNAADRVGDATRNAADNIADASRSAAANMREAGRDLSARMSEWRLSSNEIEADLKADREIVRTRTAATTTTRIDEDTIENAIKGRLAADTQLSTLKFDVNANNRGEVELEGKARTAEQVARAMAVALDSDGVTKVTSKIKLDPNAGPNRN